MIEDRGSILPSAEIAPVVQSISVCIARRVVVERLIKIHPTSLPNRIPAQPPPRTRIIHAVFVVDEVGGGVGAFGRPTPGIGTAYAVGCGNAQRFAEGPYSYRATITPLWLYNATTFPLPSYAAKYRPGSEPACCLTHNRPPTPRLPFGSAQVQPQA